MAVITYPVGQLFDDAGTLLTAPVVTITSVTDKAGTAIGTPGATVNGSASAVPISVDYDAESKGEAWITLGVTQAGHTITGANAAPVVYAAKDSSRVLTSIPIPAAGANNGLPLGDASGRTLLQPAQNFNNTGQSTNYPTSGGGGGAAAGMIIENNVLNSISNIKFVFAENTSTGLGLTGLLYNAAGLSFLYYRPGDVAETVVALVAGTLGAYLSASLVEIGGGWYQIGIPNACFVDPEVVWTLEGAANMGPVVYKYLNAQAAG